MSSRCTNGVEATRRIVGDRPGPEPAPRVVVLTTFDLDEYVHTALRAGADGFLLKNSHPDDLARALHAAVAGEPVLAPSVTRRVIDTLTALPPAFLTDTPDAPPAPGEPALTELLTAAGGPRRNPVSRSYGPVTRRP
ncbi:response regulator [Streptomyces hokutonensis]|uniref:response regulator n=1 Tax=Streptomyces hokutonensis TaxID=1306990 RepID=UPI0033FE2A37